MTTSNVVALPLMPAVPVLRTVHSSGGEFIRRLKVTGSPFYPMAGGQGDYQPRDVLLVWTTEDGADWVFRHAVIVGPQIEQRTGEPGSVRTSQTIYLGHPTYPDCEPVWLAGMVAELAPGQTTA
jgi:hypothetical protein